MDDGAEWTCNNPLWAFLLTAANRSGWQPIGTLRIDDESGEEDQSWDKENYHSNDGQGVTGKDADEFRKSPRKLSCQKRTLRESKGKPLKVFLCGYARTARFQALKFIRFPVFYLPFVI